MKPGAESVSSGAMPRQGLILVALLVLGACGDPDSTASPAPTRAGLATNLPFSLVELGPDSGVRETHDPRSVSSEDAETSQLR